ncbi:hypothetical protein FNV43_RR07037 [Rhamnella rubrinervis]|uniref:Uncharacterized protein n=1 Tax=Rhamnella rubrinervis TaxID=2594499 RepID=A0A8K0HF18_9ROSA|nr:hypothetical protein FNV43_RR07037 [Rhamnella rubrinervis]
MDDFNRYNHELQLRSSARLAGLMGGRKIDMAFTENETDSAIAFTADDFARSTHELQLICRARVTGLEAARKINMALSENETDSAIAIVQANMNLNKDAVEGARFFAETLLNHLEVQVGGSPAAVGLVESLRNDLHTHVTSSLRCIDECIWLANFTEHLNACINEESQKTATLNARIADAHGLVDLLALQVRELQLQQANEENQALEAQLAGLLNTIRENTLAGLRHVLSHLRRQRRMYELLGADAHNEQAALANQLIVQIDENIAAVNANIEQLLNAAPAVIDAPDAPGNDEEDDVPDAPGNDEEDD